MSYDTTQYEAMQMEVDAFIARLQEHYSVSAIGIFIQAPDPCGGGGRFWDGDDYSVYGMCRRHCIQQDAAWDYAEKEAQRRADED